MNKLLESCRFVFGDDSFKHMDFLPLGIMVLDKGMHVCFFNACLEFWSGLRRDVVIGRHLAEVLPNLKNGTVLTRLADIFVGGPPAVFSYHLHNHLVPAPLPDGSMRLQHGVAYGVKDDQGEVEHVILSLQDVTDLHKRLQDNIRIKAELEQEVESRKAVEVMLLEMATKDYLTKLDNRRSFFEHLEVEISRAKRSGQALSLIAMDLDHFKVINDRHGHQVGDHVLKRFAEVCAVELRAADVLARTGGEEFFIILPMAGARDARGVAERIRLAVAANGYEMSDGQEVRYTVSLGIASLATGMDMYTLLHRADQALYAAKANGRNRVEVDPESLSGGQAGAAS